MYSAFVLDILSGLSLLQIGTQLGEGAWAMGDGVLGILVHFGICGIVSIGQEDRVPAKVSRSTSSDDGSLSMITTGKWVQPDQTLAREFFKKKRKAKLLLHRCDPQTGWVRYQGLLREQKCRAQMQIDHRNHRASCSIRHDRHLPRTTCYCDKDETCGKIHMDYPVPIQSSIPFFLHIRTRKSVEGVKSKTGVLCDDRSLHLEKEMRQNRLIINVLPQCHQNWLSVVAE